MFRSCSGNIHEQRLTKPEPNGDHFLGEPCPDAVFSTYHSSNLKDSQQEETHHMMTGVQEEISYWLPGTSSGNEKKARSTSRPQFRSENTSATIEADQILLAPQHLPTNSKSANFNNNINRMSSLPISLTTTMPTFDGKSEKFELVEHLFQTSVKIQNQLKDEDKTNYFHSLKRGDALQTFKNITSLNRERIWEKIWLCSVENTWNFSQGLQQNTNCNDWSSIQWTRN